MNAVDNKVIEKEILSRPWTIPEAMLLQGVPTGELVEAREQYRVAAEGATSDMLTLLGYSIAIAGFYAGMYYGLFPLLEKLGV